MLRFRNDTRRLNWVRGGEGRQPFLPGPGQGVLGAHGIGRMNKKELTEADTNPPFGGMEEDGIESNFPSEFRTRETADLFLVLLMKVLKPGGRAGLVLPDGTLFGEGVKTRIKEALLTECNLHTVVRLPNGVFSPYTGIRTNLLFFTKGQPTTEVWYYEHPYPPGAKSYNKTKPIRIEEFEPERAWWDNRVENEQAWKINIRQVIDDARAKAQPHWDAAGQAANEAKGLRQAISDVRSAQKQLPDGSSPARDALQRKLDKLQPNLAAADQKTRAETQSGNAIYDAAFNLDLKNPHDSGTGPGDVDHLLPEYEKLLTQIAETRAALKAQLQEALTR